MNFLEVLDRKVLYPICSKIYIAHGKSTEEIKELIKSKPKLNINPKNILCCECFNKLVRDSSV
ncbi:MAG: hypothetical protein ACTSQO_14685 [Candidatus Helarchaeota archaeon]